ncbi:prohead protease/major capsid protein fusion protein [Maritalea porphyrae]|uniref:prohead protease/major capsid protein fusion protein n=1 Tax=Maritalea porphyrae TaxID=880732 RepID=UPI0022AE545A|nr:prohead protease/major capsid protein fusion protein [Maritalea porphyrae]MCZ4273998.1 HK97 family phage prohead protease [Maritalea porphyrae]
MPQTSKIVPSVPTELIGNNLARFVLVSPSTYDEENRTVEAVFSAGSSRMIYGIEEVLEISKEAINLERLEKDIVPFLDHHNKRSLDAVLGKVVSASINDGKLIGTIKFGEGDSAKRAEEMVRNGELSGLSIGYTVEQWTQVRTEGADHDTLTATKWTLLEVSLVSVPADAEALIRSAIPHKDFNRADAQFNQEVTQVPKKAEGQSVAPIENTPDEQTRGAIAEATTQVDANTVTRAERTRISEIHDIGKRAGMSHDDIKTAIDSEDSVDDFRKRAFEKMAKVSEAAPITATTSITADGRDRFIEGASLGMMARAAIGGERNEFTSLRLEDLARESLERTSVSTRGMDRMPLVGEAFTRSGSGMHSTADFPLILQNVARLSMLKGFDEIEETFSKFTSVGTHTDFKEVKRVDVGLFPELAPKGEGGEYKHATIGESGVSAFLSTYGRTFGVTREMIINDDLNAITKIPLKMGRAAKRTIGTLVFLVFTNPAYKFKGKDLFHADYKNLSAGSLPTISSLKAARKSMAMMQDDGKVATALNIAPKYIICGPETSDDIAVLLAAQADPDAKHVGVPNVVRNMAELVQEGRISNGDFFLLADQHAHDTIEVTYLEGNEEPFLDQTDVWRKDGTEFKVRQDVGVNVLSEKGLHKVPQPA